MPGSKKNFVRRQEQVIYALVHPVTMDICYIGMSRQWSSRKQCHLGSLRLGTHNNLQLQIWYDHLVQTYNQEPHTCVLEHLPGASKYDLLEREAAWIHTGKDQNWPLINKYPR